MCYIFTVLRDPGVLSMVYSEILCEVLPERVLPFLPPGLSLASRMVVSRSMRPALRSALPTMAREPGTGADAEDIATQREVVDEWWWLW